MKEISGEGKSAKIYSPDIQNYPRTSSDTCSMCIKHLRVELFDAILYSLALILRLEINGHQ